MPFESEVSAATQMITLRLAYIPFILPCCASVGDEIEGPYQRLSLRTSECSVCAIRISRELRQQVPEHCWHASCAAPAFYRHYDLRMQQYSSRSDNCVPALTVRDLLLSEPESGLSEVHCAIAVQVRI